MELPGKFAIVGTNEQEIVSSRNSPFISMRTLFNRQEKYFLTKVLEIFTNTEILYSGSAIRYLDLMYIKEVHLLTLIAEHTFHCFGPDALGIRHCLCGAPVPHIRSRMMASAIVWSLDSFGRIRAETVYCCSIGSIDTEPRLSQTDMSSSD